MFTEKQIKMLAGHFQIEEEKLIDRYYLLVRAKTL